MKVSAVCFYLFIVLKQFYFFPSGSLGMGDVCLVLSFLSAFCSKKTRLSVSLFRRDILFYIFLVCVIVTNGIYGIYYENREFFKYSLYMIFAGITIWTFQALYSGVFLRRIVFWLKVDILIQAAFCILGIGRNYYESWGGIRYMGTFNDPNQFAFFLFAATLMLYLHFLAQGDKSFFVFYGISVLLIGTSKSTGIFLGILFFTAGMLGYGIALVLRKGRVGKLQICILLVLIFVLTFLGLHFSESFARLFEGYSLLTRILDKVNKLINQGMIDLLQDRSAGAVLYHPEYLLAGAGEGVIERFFAPGKGNEIHCSILSIMFCYGIGATSILVLWLVNNLKCIEPRVWIVLIALFTESMLLINYRQPFFWLVIVWGAALKRTITKE